MGAPQEQRSAADAGFMDFVYSITHDLRSPLVNVRALALELRLAFQELEPLKVPGATITEEQARKIAAAVSGDIPGALEHIEECVSRMVNHMAQLTQLARLAHIELQLSDIDPQAIINRIVLKMNQDAEGATSPVRLCDLPRVYADPIAIEQIFTHLLRNALQYGAPDRSPLVEVTGWQDGNNACICVQDNGRGISAEDCERIFAPFRRVGKRDIEGDGMGLPIVQALVSRLNGGIKCDSQAGQGSRFTVTLPGASSS